ncbi:MAG TPA: presqualene diphosphate synthase HpnD [Blastocatellia bacterium]|nr:presqualene diphosphate synthase HpnD [Blastocatellia bacterium]
MDNPAAGTFSRAPGGKHALASGSGSNFYYSFFFLPSAKRRAIKDVYAFCRILDDIVDRDESADDPFSELAFWRDEIEACYRGQPVSPFGEQLTDTIEAFDLPIQPFLDLVEGMEMDLRWHSYQTFADLREYCYRVASSVGLICIEIFEYESPRTREYAVNLGLALQLTNVLRDLKEDVGRGRIYIPLEDLDRFGYSENDLRALRYNSPFIEMMRFEHARARSYFEKAAATLPESDRKSMVAAEIMGAIYKEVLEGIRAVQYDVFRNRVTVPKKRRLATALSIWARSRLKR